MKYYTFIQEKDGRYQYQHVVGFGESAKTAYLGLSNDERSGIKLDVDDVPLHYDAFEEVEVWCVAVTDISSRGKVRGDTWKFYYHTKEEAIKASCKIKVDPFKRGYVIEIYPVSLIELVTSHRGVI